MADISWRTRIKEVLARVIYGLGLHRRIMRGRDVIVLFHRVDDELGNNPISSTARAFREHCAFLARHFPVVPLREIVASLESGGGPEGRVCITFDDGYLDNCTVAAPILRDLGIPACFFIATDMIGSDEIPSWDEEMGIESKWMEWDQVRELAETGFEIGAHTMRHVDLGRTHGEEALAEVAGSRARLEKELGIEIPWFSYPFGRVDQITEANRTLVRDLGFRCCLSAFGGEVRKDSDPFDLPRLPVSPWYRSPWHLGWEILFGNR